MKSIGSFLAILGLAAIGFGYMDRVPTILSWIYNWGDGAAWGIKIALTVVGGVMWFAGRQRERANIKEIELVDNVEQNTENTQ